MLSFLACSLVAAYTDTNDVWAKMISPVVGMQHITSDRSPSLEHENFEKTSRNFFDLKPSCEQLGPRYCDYDPHSLGSGLEFASWTERTQFMYTNMARMDSAKFAQAPYNATYACETRSGLMPFSWSSELTQASRFHSNEMATFNHFDHSTAPSNADLFGGSVGIGDRIAHFMTSGTRSLGENIAAGRGDPLRVTKQWLGSADHCSQIFGVSSLLGVGYVYKASAQYRHYWTQNFWTGHTLPTQDLVAGTHDTTSNTNRFLAQVHMSQALETVSVVIGNTKKPMSLLLGTAKIGTYFVDVATLPAGESDGCVRYHFEVNGVSRMPADSSYHFLTYGINDCKRNIGQDLNTDNHAFTMANASHSLSETPTTECFPWCLRHPTPWYEKCSWHSCSGCKEQCDGKVSVNFV